MTRTREQDACPGALTVHQAADGALVRLRFPGGMVTPDQLTALAEVAETYGSPAMELTSRGNVQIRAVTDTGGAAAALSEAGLLPSPTHERARNIVASPLSGRRGGHLDVRPLVTALDRAIQAEPTLAGLPGRFWFSLDDGRGDISGVDADTGIHALPDGTCALLLAGRDTGVRVAVDDTVPTLIAIARRFLDVRGKAWRINELDDPSALLAGLPVTASAGATWAPTPLPPVGWFPQTVGKNRDRVALGAAVPLGVLQARVAHFLAALDAPVLITPWRSVLVCDVPEPAADTALRVLAPLGLVFDEQSPWLRVSACTGTPGCAKSLADVRADATAAVRAAETGPDDDTHRHFVGCDRACGSPPSGEVLIAGQDGYRLRVAPP